MTQRQLEVEPVPLPEAPSPRAVDREVRAKVEPSNLGLLERQRRWIRERQRFETATRADEGSK